MSTMPPTGSTCHHRSRPGCLGGGSGPAVRTFHRGAEQPSGEGTVWACISRQLLRAMGESCGWSRKAGLARLRPQRFAGRFGFACNPAAGATGDTRRVWHLLRSPFDNLWQNLRNNNLVSRVLAAASVRLQLSSALGSVLTQQQDLIYERLSRADDVPAGFRDRMCKVTSWESSSASATPWTIEINATGALGRELITTDLLNRPDSVRSARQIRGF